MQAFNPVGNAIEWIYQFSYFINFVVYMAFRARACYGHRYEAKKVKLCGAERRTRLA